MIEWRALEKLMQTASSAVIKASRYTAGAEIIGIFITNFSTPVQARYAPSPSGYAPGKSLHGTMLPDPGGCTSIEISLDLYQNRTFWGGRVSSPGE